MVGGNTTRRGRHGRAGGHEKFELCHHGQPWRVPGSTTMYLTRSSPLHTSMNTSTKLRARRPSHRLSNSLSSTSFRKFSSSHCQRNHYEALSVPRNASKGQIKACLCIGSVVQSTNISITISPVSIECEFSCFRAFVIF
jgi:hypothetical protein